MHWFFAVATLGILSAGCAAAADADTVVCEEVHAVLGDASDEFSADRSPGALGTFVTLAYILTEEHPDCFTVKQRAEAESLYRMWRDAQR